MTKALRKQHDNLNRDTKERITVLRMQAMAWRHVAIIACLDPIRGKQYARWLFSKTVPFTDGAAVQKFIDDTEEETAQAGRKSGVFDR